MFTYTILIGLGAALVYFWNYIVDFFQTVIIPWFRNVFGDIPANILASIVKFCDKVISWTRRQIKHAWKWFQTKVLGMKTEYTKVSSSEVKGKTTTYVQGEDGKVIRTIKTEQLDWDDVPDNVREQYIANNRNSFTVDDKNVLEGKFVENVKQSENMSDQQVAELLEIQIA